MDAPEKESQEALTTVNLKWAYAWYCPECHKRNFAATVAVELLEDEIRDMFGLEKYADITPEQWDDSGELFSSPAVVRCSRCSHSYVARPPEDIIDLSEEYEEGGEEEEEGI